MEIISFKEMAKLAKARLKDGNYYNKPVADLNYNSKTIDIQKVIEIVESDEIIENPIQRLINTAYYETLTNNFKQKYVLDIARDYRRLKHTYLNSKKLNNVK